MESRKLMKNTKKSDLRNRDKDSHVRFQPFRTFGGGCRIILIHEII
jgi:hypothetical protein